jgi:hypothetical protein
MEPNLSYLPSLKPWAIVVAVLVGPSVLVWAVRLTALFAGCAPEAGLCRGMALGAGLRDSLGLAWVVSTNALLLVTLSLAATLIAFRACRPLAGTLSMAVLPILTPMLPILAVLSVRYDGCADAAGCSLWGASMATTFQAAAAAREVVFGVVPYTFALTVMLGVLGFCFARPKPPPEPHPMAKMRHSLGDDERFG